VFLLSQKLVFVISLNYDEREYIKKTR